MTRLAVPIHRTQRLQRSSNRTYLLHPVVGLVGDEDIALAVGRQTLWIMELAWKLPPLAGTESV